MHESFKEAELRNCLGAYFSPSSGSGQGGKKRPLSFCYARYTYKHSVKFPYDSFVSLEEDDNLNSSYLF